MSRSTLLDATIEATILGAIAKGNYRETAARKAGVSERSLRNWCERGRTGEEPFAAFLAGIEKAEAIAEGDLLEQIRTAEPAQGSDGVTRGADVWTSRAWIMERRWPKRWAARVRASVTEELSALMDKLEKKLDAETMAKVIDATREDAASSPADDARH